MNTIQHIITYFGICCGFTISLCSQSALAQGTTREQLQMLTPSKQDLQGFTSIRPAGELPSTSSYSQSQQKWVESISPVSPLHDEIVVNAAASQWQSGWAQLSNHPGKFDQITRPLYTSDGLYQLTMTINVCDSPDMAKDEVHEYLRGCSTRFQPGTFSSSSAIGDASWFNPNGYSTLIFQAGKSVVVINGALSHSASQESIIPPFPERAVEATAYQILFRASQQPELTGVSAQQASMSVNGHAVAKNALVVSGQTFVPVTEFAKAMGLTSDWDTKTGALTLSGPGRKTVALKAGSTASTVDGVKAAALTVPVLKQAGQPVMTLDDLLTVTGGHVTGRSGNDVQVKG